MGQAGFWPSLASDYFVQYKRQESSTEWMQPLCSLWHARRCDPGRRERVHEQESRPAARDLAGREIAAAVSPVIRCCCLEIGTQPTERSRQDRECASLLARKIKKKGAAVFGERERDREIQMMRGEDATRFACSRHRTTKADRRPCLCFALALLLHSS